jgi:tetratricopeptide (TPR) repeat protein
MTVGWKATSRWGHAALLAACLGLWSPPAVRAQSEVDAAAESEVDAAAESADTDAAAREHFLLGRAAYRGADYEQALAHFRRAHELSQRSQLLYNIAISADRFGNDEEALEAFISYLEENENSSRDQEVRERIAFLRLAIGERNEKERLVAEAAALDAAAAANRDDSGSGRRMPTSAIVGGSVLAAVGVAGIATMGLGLSQNGSCLETDTSGTCVTERTASPWTTVYGVVGIAAVAGSVAWFTVSSRRGKRKETAWMLSPTGITVSGSF